jgi:hypothetical protein
MLVWAVVARGLAAYLAEISPADALRLQATQANALVNIAKEKLHELDLEKGEPPSARADAGDRSTQPSQADKKLQAEIRSLVERALFNDPLNANAFQVLGQLSIQLSDDKQAQALMQAAIRHSLYDSEAVDWMMRKSYETHDYKTALQYVDILLRTRRNSLDYAMPVLGKIADEGGVELTQLLSKSPPWREEFFRSLAQYITDARAPLVIFLRLRSTPAPPKNEELRDYLNFLVGSKLYGLAYYTWLQFLPAEELARVGSLFNGDFEAGYSGMPFDWVWKATRGTAVEIASLPNDEGRGRVLNMQFESGRIDFPRTTQLVMLPPGNYQFRGTYKADITSQRGMQWRVVCAGREEGALGQSSEINGKTPSWKAFQFSFYVPEADCPAQYVILDSGARSASEKFISGVIAYNDLKIVNESVVTPMKKQL